MGCSITNMMNVFDYNKVQPLMNKYAFALHEYSQSRTKDRKKVKEFDDEMLELGLTPAQTPYSKYEAGSTVQIIKSSLGTKILIINGSNYRIE